MNFQYTRVLLGADPELFLINKATGKFHPACDLVGGSKEKPRKIDRMGHAVQEDNVMVEYNIKPARDVNQWIKSHKFVLDYLRKVLPEYDLAIVASHEFEKQQLTHPKAKEFGCDPDYNAWTLTINPRPTPKTSLRTSGGHAHFGYTKPRISNQISLVKAFDLFVTVPSILLDPDERRRARYGKAGAFRPKRYGVECRGVSNFWLSSPKMMAWMYNNCMRAVDFLNKDTNAVPQLNEMKDLIVNTINNGNKQAAENLSEEFNLLQGV